MPYYAIGRHKSAIAKVFITELETEIKTKITTENTLDTDIENEDEIEIETITINNKTIFDYFQDDRDAIIQIRRQFFVLDDIPPFPSLDIRIKISGGGKIGQQKAVCLALARALYQMGFSTHIFKQENLLTQDSRVKERKKYGLKKARKAPQYSKR